MPTPDFLSYQRPNSEGKPIGELSHSHAKKRVTEESRIFLASIVDSSEDSIISVNFETIITSWNKAAENLYGYRADEVLGQALTVLALPEDLMQVLSNVDKIRHGETVAFFDTIRINKDGREMDLEVSLSPIKDASGRVVGVSTIARDITQRKEVEAALRESEEHLRFVIDASNDGIWEWDIVTGKVSWSERIYAILGLSVETFTPTYESQLALVHPDDMPAFIQAITAHLENGDAFNLRLRYRHSDGTYRQILAQGRTQRDEAGCPLRMIGSFSDLTTLIKAETEREENSREIITIWESMTDAFFSLDHDWRFTRVNSHTAQLWERDAAELIGKNIWEEFPAAVGTKFQAEYSRAMTEQVAVTFEAFYPPTNVWREVHVYPSPLGLSIYFRDVTDRRAAGLALLQAKDDLEVRVAQRTSELGEVNESLRLENIQHQITMDTLREVAEDLGLAKEEADKANAAKSEFLSRMSHELRTPLNAILGFGQILEKRHLGLKENQGVQQILRAGRHLLNLINEVLDISRIEAGHFELSLESLDLNETIAEVCALVRPLAAERRITLHQSAALPDSRYVLADSQRLKQVLLNLLSNAIKYNREDGQVFVSYESMPEQRIAIKVRDTGIGISPQDLPKLFTPFERLDAANSLITGTGLGLVLSKRLVTFMNGTLEVESTPGEGTTLTLKLPQAASVEIQMLNPTEDIALFQTATATTNVEKLSTILCIEDNLSNLRFIEAIFEMRPQWTLLSAMQGSIGLDLARHHLPDLILLDLNLPDVSGKEILSRLQRSALTQKIPVVIISADANPAQIDALLANGAKAYLTKPLDINQFSSTLEKLLLPNYL